MKYADIGLYESAVCRRMTYAVSIASSDYISPNNSLSNYVISHFVFIVVYMYTN